MHEDAVAAEPDHTTGHERIYLAVLALSVGAVAVCGIVYQLIVGTVSTYLQGNSTYQFSLTVGLFMSAYGIGSFLSTRVKERILDIFVLSELLIGLVGGASTVLLVAAYAETELFWLGRGALILVLGSLVGLEIPLLIRLAERYRRNLRVTVGQILGFDYVGALIGGIAFPIVLLPWLGFVGSAIYVGIFNTVVAVAVLCVFRHAIVWRRAIWACAIVVAGLLCTAAFSARSIEVSLEQGLYEDHIVFMEQTPYQRIVLTRRADDLRLYLDGALQFSSKDEHRYHESLVHPAASRLQRLERVLVLGGGDGLALRELARYPSIQSILLVDIDPASVQLGRENELVVALNEGSFAKVPVTIRFEDAYNVVEELAKAGDNQFDLILSDLPDPRHESLAKLYSVPFYANLRKLLAPGGLAALQLGSPFFSNRTFWCSVATLREAGWLVRPYHVNVPSFGEWGFGLAGDGRVPEAPGRRFAGRFYETEHDSALFHFPPDLRSHYDVEISTLMRPRIMQYFEKDWRGWN